MEGLFSKHTKHLTANSLPYQKEEWLMLFFRKRCIHLVFKITMNDQFSFVIDIRRWGKRMIAMRNISLIKEKTLTRPFGWAYYKYKQTNGVNHVHLIDGYPITALKSNIRPLFIFCTSLFPLRDVCQHLLAARLHNACYTLIDYQEETNHWPLRLGIKGQEVISASTRISVL